MLAHGVNLVGRQHLSSQLAHHMSQGKVLVTLHGAPGVGKGALAGAWLCGQDALRVDLCGVREPKEAAALLLRMLEGKMPEEGGLDAIMERVVAASSGAPTVWLIEHLDHLAEAFSPWLARLHQRLDAVRWLITSRQPLHVQSERVLDVPPLQWDAQDPHDCPAGALFCQCAQLDPQGLDVSERAALAKVLELTSGVARSRTTKCPSLGGGGGAAGALGAPGVAHAKAALMRIISVPVNIALCMGGGFSV